MNSIKSFLNPLKEISFSLRDNSDLKSNNIYNSLSQIFNVDENWREITSHRELLERISTQLNHHSKGKTSWEGYKKHLQNIFDNIDIAFENYDLLSSELLAVEDPVSLRWYSYLMRADYHFKNRIDLLSHYLKIRQIEFNRYELKNLNMFGVSFTTPWTLPDFNSMDTIEVAFREKMKKSFFKSKLGWLYLYNSRLLYCNFALDNLRNAIFHEVDCRYSSFSSEDKKGDLMGADFSFCDARFTDFSYCYARETKFYSTNLDYAKFDSANLIGPLFLNSSLKNASFTNLAGNMLCNASFKNSNLQGADFTNTELINVDFRGADLRNVKGIKSFSRNLVHIDEQTRF
ncbi:pentapeptide repeat-containing protein [Legionella saoudiensis]|uniref:pentapeptide repeat-containing protein n=1 Tax=Legionella saoudiensis TaxID=1750561 RepID=UPI00073109F8|nr:pentapeptide repeat-containing protein [Legionella saoudiensis]